MISKQFAKRRKDSAVSPVIATILMVAITVVLAAVLYVMVGGFTHNPGTAQSAGLTEQQNTNNNWTITISSISASNIQITSLKLVINGTSASITVAPAVGASTANLGTAATSIWFNVLSGNSVTYVNVGDSFYVKGALSGATGTLYSGNSQLGTVTL